MEVLKTFIVHKSNKLETLFYCGDGNYFITTNGAFGQRETYLEIMPPMQAEKLIHESSE